MPEGLGRRRFDFVNRLTVDEDGNVSIQMLPDPMRYEWVDRDGERLLFDRLDRAYFPVRMVEDMYKFASETPAHYDPPAISNSDSYVADRVRPFSEMLNGPGQAATFEDASDEFLRSLPSGPADFVIMSVDIAGSTQLSTSTEGYSRIIAAVTTELSRTVPLFRGHVLKYTGDGFIAYFPAPNMVGKHDLAIDCAITLLKLITLAVNPALRDGALAELGLRIGMDSGSADVTTLGDPSTKQQVDLIGQIVSLACKIQGQAPIGGIALGDAVVRSLHTRWRLGCEPLATDSSWVYMKGNDRYPLHRWKSN